MIFIGIDPGSKGTAVALNAEKNSAEVLRLKFFKDSLFDDGHFKAWVQSLGQSIIYLEKVKAGQGWGSSQVFNYGVRWGQIFQTIASGSNSYFLITPQRWQKDFHTGIETKITAKEKTMIAYNRLYPNKPVPCGPKSGKPNDNIIDALMIATYAMGRHMGYHYIGQFMILNYLEHTNGS